MVKKEFLFLFGILLATILFSNLSNAAILMENPDGIYSLGDKVNFQAKVTYSAPLNGFFRAQIICKDFLNRTNSTLVYYSPILLETNKEKKISFDYLASVSGRCYFYSTLESSQLILDNSKTNEFDLRDGVNLTIIKNKEQFKPGEEIKIEGVAVKENGDNFNGNLSFYFDKPTQIVVTDGKFSFSLSIPKEIKSYNHTTRFTAIDNNLNHGITEMNFYVIPVPTSLSVNLSNSSITPGKTIVISPVLYDQGNEPLNYSILTAIYNGNKLVFVKDVNSTSNTSYQLEGNSAPGIYSVKTNYDSLEKDVNLTVLEHYEINTKIENGTLFVENKGNVKYDKWLLILFNLSEENKTFNNTIKLNLDVGKSSTYILEAPKGNYTISLFYPTESEYKEQKFSDQFLTGSIIASTTLDHPQFIQGNLLNYSAIFLVFLLLILVLIFALTKKKSSNYNVYDYSKYGKGDYKEYRPTVMSASEFQIQQKQSRPKQIQQKPLQIAAANPKPRVFEPKVTTNSLKTNLEKQRDISKLREDARPYIERALRK